MEAEFHWHCEPQAELFLEELLQHMYQHNQALAEFSQNVTRYTSTRLFDWIDHVRIGQGQQHSAKLSQLGFRILQATPQGLLWHHPAAQLPLILAYNRAEPEQQGVAVRVDSIAEFLLIHGLNKPIEGSPYSGYRCCQVLSHREACLWVVERRGSLPLYPIYQHEEYLGRYLLAQQQWYCRQRDLVDEERAMDIALETAAELVQKMGGNIAAWIVLEGERRYWQARNSAAQLQKNRQDTLGLGWANHDHHTFRSSRRHFAKLVRLFEVLGFHCRERFWAGKEAGWGAQVMENAACGLVLFLDVDLAGHEIEIDFAHQPLEELDRLGTIGLWCALHGDSILKAGMHHLEAQFLFDQLTEDLAHKGIRMMEPFSNFSYLKQAFTAGEIWPVAAERLDKLLKSGKITAEEAERFRTHGAVGSHLENLQRREGYKGFNQKNVSYIIKKTDPRLAHV